MPAIPEALVAAGQIKKLSPRNFIQKNEKSQALQQFWSFFTSLLSVCEEKSEVWNDALERIESICSKSSDSRRFLMAFSAPISDKYEKTGCGEPFQSHLLEFFKRSEPEIYEWFARWLGRKTGL